MNCDERPAGGTNGRLIAPRDDATVVRHAFSNCRGMQPQTLEKRAEKLERRVTALETLPARVTALEVQISEFRAEVRAEFSATRTELCQEMHSLNDETRAQMRMLHEEVLARFSLLDEHLGRKPARRPRVAKTPRG